jgi:hypothetical protein
LRLNLARGLIGAVIIFNLQAAVVFLLRPELYVPSFELQGAVGEAVLRGFGVLFLMWNIPYAVAVWNPIRNRVSLYEALGMQSIGLVGEGMIYLSLPAVHQLARASILHFITFDAMGLLLLLLAAWLIRKD